MRHHEITNRILSDLTFRSEHKGFAHGQDDYALIALLHGHPVAKIDYMVYQGKPSIHMITVKQRRVGIGTATLRYLQSLFPDIEIDWGLLTDEGSALYHSMIFRDIPNPVYTKLQAALQRTRAKLADYAEQAEMFYANPSEQARQALAAATADWNDLHSREYKIERALYGLKPAKRLIA